MKKLIYFMLIILAIATFTSCSRVQPNHVGVLMENFGKNGKSDYSIVQGRVNVMAPGTTLFQAPLWEQRGEFSSKDADGNVKQTVLHLKAADNTEFSARITYSYIVIKERAIDIVFNNAQVSEGATGEDFLNLIEDNILEPRIYDYTKELSRKFITDELMANSGSLKFEDSLEMTIHKAFEEMGFILKTFSCPLEFSNKVTEKIDQRNEVNTNIGVLDQKIAEQRKTNELEELKTQQMIIRSRGITPQLLQKDFIDKWDGKTPIYGSAPFFIKSINN